jgi:hypothetical protein
MTDARFEEIPAWQESIRLAEGTYDMTESKGWPGSRSLQDQLERAALSVPVTAKFYCIPAGKVRQAAKRNPW